MRTRVLRGVRLDGVDKRSQVGVALRRVRQELTDHLGGDASAPERILVEEAAKARVIAAAVGDWILRQETLVRDDGELLAVVMQHAQLVGNLTRILAALGLKRAAREKDVAVLLAEMHEQRAAAEKASPAAGEKPRGDGD